MAGSSNSEAIWFLILSADCELRYISIKTFISTGKLGDLAYRQCESINGSKDAYPRPLTGSQPLAAGNPGESQPGLLPETISLKASGC